MNFPNWGKLFQALARAAADLKANAPRPAAAPMTSADALAALERVETALPTIKAWLAAHPGALTAADDLLDALAAQGVSWAADLRSGVDGASGALSAASAALSVLDELMKATAPAATGIPGAWSGARGHIL